MNKFKDEKNKTNKTTNKSKSMEDANLNKKKEDKELDKKLEDTFPASDSTAEY